MVSVPTIGPAITYIVPSAAAHVDGTQLVANLSPKVDLQPALCMGSTTTTQVRLWRASFRRKLRISLSSAMRWSKDPSKNRSLSKSANPAHTRPGKQGLWPKEEKIGIPSTNAGDFSAASADNIILARLEVDADAVLSAKRRVSVENHDNRLGVADSSRGPRGCLKCAERCSPR